MIVVIDWHDVCTSQYYNPYKPGGMYIYICVCVCVCVCYIYYGLYNTSRLMNHGI